MNKIPIYPTPPAVLDYYRHCNTAEDEDKKKPRPTYDVLEYLAIKGYKKQFAAIDSPKGQTSNMYDIEAYTEEIRYHIEKTHPNKENKFFLVGKYSPTFYEENQIFQHSLSLQNFNTRKAYELFHIGKKMSLYASACDFLSDYRRTNEYVNSVSSLMIDIDYYNISEYSVVPPELLYNKIVSEIFTPLGIDPNYGIFSGNGLYVVFLIEPLLLKDNLQNKAAYTQTLKALVELTKAYGADPAATDLARVFRLPTTRNPKTGAYSRILNFETVNTTAQYRHNLFDIIDKLKVALPSRESEQKPTAAVVPDNTLRKPPVKHTGKPYIGGKLTLQSLGRARVNDLYKWLANRKFAITGYRNTFFLILSSAVLAYMSPDEALKYIQSINGTLTEPQGKSELASTFNKAVTNYQKRLDNKMGYFSFSNLYIIDKLGIMDKEMSEFSTIISTEEKQRRGVERQRQARRNEQCNTKREQNKADKQAQISALLQQGNSQAEIAAKMGVSRQLVNRYSKL